MTDYNKSTICRKCGSNDWRTVKSKGYVTRKCKSCESKYQKGRYFQRLRTHYGITEKEYNEWLEVQGGVCAICSSPPPEDELLFVDHNKLTSEIRGLLCRNCNVGIGMLRHDPKLLAIAAECVK